MSASPLYDELFQRVVNHVHQIYTTGEEDELSRRLIEAMGLNEKQKRPRWYKNNWNEADIVLITYANTLLEEERPPLESLYDFLLKYLKEDISMLHILPFFPFSSDDGFAVINYTQVNESFGDWMHIEKIAKKFKLMSDLVINHCSAMSIWFEQFRQNKAPGKDYFLVADPDQDFSQVVRPRTSPLLREVQTRSGLKHVWCTFSHDQPDLDFRNPEVLLEMLRIIKSYIDYGVRIFRLDAVAFLWKEQGSSCLNLPQTHEIIRLIRTLTEYYRPGTIIITETNIPSRENLSYFGNANEAHVIYNFPFAPLVLHTLATGDCHALKNWMMSMPPAQNGTTYLNFIASHDGIGLRPVEGLLSEDDINHLIGAMESFGGMVSWRSYGNNGKVKPYEINISLFDACKGTIENGPDAFQEQRFICGHAIMLSIEGIPAFYFHSLLSTENDFQKFANTNNNRAINRKNWDLNELEILLAEDNHHARIFTSLRRLIAIRKRQPAFHPNAIQFTLHLGDQVFAFWRQSVDRQQSIFCLNNISDQGQEILLSDINLIATDEWVDLISGDNVHPDQEILALAPYQSVWLTNKHSS